MNKVTKNAIRGLRIMFNWEDEDNFDKQRTFYTTNDLETEAVAEEFRNLYDSTFEVRRDERPIDLYGRIQKWIDDEIR